MSCLQGNKGNKEKLKKMTGLRSAGPWKAETDRTTGWVRAGAKAGSGHRGGGRARTCEHVNVLPGRGKTTRSLVWQEVVVYGRGEQKAARQRLCGSVSESLQHEDIFRLCSMTGLNWRHLVFSNSKVWQTVKSKGTTKSKTCRKKMNLSRLKNRHWKLGMGRENWQRLLRGWI